MVVNSSNAAPLGAPNPVNVGSAYAINADQAFYNVYVGYGGNGTITQNAGIFATNQLFEICLVLLFLTAMLDERAPLG